MEDFTTTQEKNAGTYEISFIQKSEDDRSVIDAIRSFGGAVIEEQQLTKIRSAYPLKKETQGFLGIIQFSMEPDATNRFIASLELNEDILRSMVHRVSGNKKEFSGRPQIGFRGRMQSRKGIPQRRYDDSSAPQPLSNEALEKKIEEILQ